jgi:hypothetical protein
VAALQSSTDDLGQHAMPRQQVAWASHHVAPTALRWIPRLPNKDGRCVSPAIQKSPDRCACGLSSEPRSFHISPGCPRAGHMPWTPLGCSVDGGIGRRSKLPGNDAQPWSALLFESYPNKARPAAVRLVLDLALDAPREAFLCSRLAPVLGAIFAPCLE